MALNRHTWPGVALVAIGLALGGPAAAKTIEFGTQDGIAATGTNGSAQRIRALIADRQFDKALAEIQALEKTEPDKAMLANLAGTVYLAKNDRANARKSFERAATLMSDPRPAILRLVELDLAEGNTEAPTRRLQAILAKEPNNVDAMIGMAGVAATAKRDSEAESWMTKAIAAAPASARPRVLLINYYLTWKHDPARAVVAAQEARTVLPNDPDVLLAQGNAQMAAGNIGAALVTYRALAIQPQQAAAYGRVATAEVALGDFASARTSLNRAIAANPGDLESRYLLGTVEIQTGRRPEATRIAQQLEKDQPGSPAGAMLQGDILMAQKDYKGARGAYERAAAVRNSGGLAVKTHAAMSAAGDTKAADDRLLGWLARNPGDQQARAYLATIYARTGRTNDATQQYELLLKNDPYSALALNDLAGIYQQAKDPRALAMAERAYKVMPANGHVLDTLGWILVEKGETARGLEMLRRAVEALPNAPTIRYHLAAAMAKTGDNAQARQELEAVLKRNAAFAQRADAEGLLKQLQR